MDLLVLAGSLQGPRRSLTKVVHNVGFAPLRTVRTRRVGVVADGSVEHQIIDLVLPKLFESLLRKSLDCFKI